MTQLLNEMVPLIKKGIDPFFLWIIKLTISLVKELHRLPLIVGA